MISLNWKLRLCALSERTRALIEKMSSYVLSFSMLMLRVTGSTIFGYSKGYSKWLSFWLGMGNVTGVMALYLLPLKKADEAHLA